jgi:NAD-dependent dihydropyrimidine dehydrogenase PreA subunit
MTSATVRIGEGCTACGLCIMTCPETALRPAPRQPAVIDHRCTGCLACIEVCPRDCITEWFTPAPAATAAAAGPVPTALHRPASVTGPTTATTLTTGTWLMPARTPVVGDTNRHRGNGRQGIA